MSDLSTQFIERIRATGLISEGDRVLVALSGGVDSVVLLHLLRAAAKDLGITIHAAHFDHAMRTDSEADAQWVSELCQKWQVPLIQERASRQLEGETAARDERYRFLYRAQKEAGANRIALAHHADDQVETVLHRLMRGAGLRGLAGMPRRRGPFIRPLLRFFKKQLLAYANDQSISFREDPSNADTGYTRNRIRRVLLPTLAQARPGVRRSVLNLAAHAARTEQAWRELMKNVEADVVLAHSHGFVELARPRVLEYDPEVRARVIRHFLRRFGVVPSRSSTLHIMQFVDNAQSGTALEVAGRVAMERSFDSIRIERLRESPQESSHVAFRCTTGRSVMRVAGHHYDVAWTIGDTRTDDTESFDMALLADSLELRAWQAGDRITLPYGTKKLKKLFAERRLAVSERERVPVLVDKHGRVLWVVGVARSVHALPAPAGPALNITVKDAELE